MSVWNHIYNEYTLIHITYTYIRRNISNILLITECVATLYQQDKNDPMPDPGNLQYAIKSTQFIRENYHFNEQFNLLYILFVHVSKRVYTLHTHIISCMFSVYSQGGQTDVNKCISASIFYGLADIMVNKNELCNPIYIYI